jgi:glutathione S-transferase
LKSIFILSQVSDRKTGRSEPCPTGARLEAAVMKLYYLTGACSLAPHIALREVGADFTLVRYNLTSGGLEGDPPIEQVNDKGFVPVLELEDGQRLTEVSAVLQYVADSAPERKLAPPAGTMERRYRLIEWLNYVATEVHKSFWPFFHGGDEVENRKAREKLTRSLQ